MELQKRTKSPHALSAGKQKELFESGPPFPTRQLPIYAEQLKNSPATWGYSKGDFRACLTPWCPSPFGAWDALAVAKASFVGFGSFVRHFALAYTPFLGWAAGGACLQNFLWACSNFAQAGGTLAQPVEGQAIRAGRCPPSYHISTCLPNTLAQLVYRAGKKPKLPTTSALNFIANRRS